LEARALQTEIGGALSCQRMLAFLLKLLTNRHNSAVVSSAETLDSDTECLSEP